MYLPEDKSPDFELCPQGTFSARCVRFVDLGTHTNSYGKEQRKVMLGFEFPTELMEDGRPFLLTSRYTWSMYEKAILRQQLEAWRGRKFKEEDFGEGGFNIKDVLGVPATVTVTYSENNDKTYANITSIGPVMKGLEVPPQIGETVYFSLVPEFFDQNIFHGLSDNLKATIQKSPEWVALARSGEGKTEPPAQEGYGERNPPPPSEDDYKHAAGF